MRQPDALQADMCAARTRAGEPCGARPVTGSPYCWAHAPELARKRTEARQRGGKASHGLGDGPPPEVRLRAASDVLSLLETAAGDCLAMKPSERRARALAYVAQAALRAVEVAELEGRIEALEAVTLSPWT